MEARTRVVLEEDAYASALERLVEREFFPYLVEMRQRWSWMACGSAVRETSFDGTDDSQSDVKGRDTPIEAWDGDGKSAEEREKMLLELHRKIDRGRISLEGFLNRYTSEDNHAFRKIVDQVARKRKERLRIAGVDDATQQAVGVTSTCMPPPQAVPWDRKAKSLLEDGRGSTGPHPSQPRRPGARIAAQNTRFAVGRGEGAVSEPSTSFSGTPVMQSPQYQYVSTPIIRPGEGGDTPIMTWGNLDDVVPLDEEEWPAQSNRFRIPPTPTRDAVARTLSGSTPRPHSRGSKRGITAGTSPGQPLSPAGKRLASRALAQSPLSLHKDTKLRQSYVKTPASRPTVHQESPSVHRSG